MIDGLLLFSVLNFEENSELENLILTVLGVVLILVIVIFAFRVLFYFFEMAYVEYVNKRLFFNQY
jgi:hypothetical protein